MTAYTLINSATDSLTIDRCEAVAGVLRRLHFGNSPVCSNDIHNSIRLLRDAGRLAVTEEGDCIELFYVPSQAALESILNESSPWPSTICKRHSKALRRSEGALFTLPFEDGNGTLDAFITDWSPFPGATALAVHKDHPLACNAGRRSGSYFTGQFVRHPLTGDLLPVWVAPFVLPDYGTGVVIVNPAHSEKDLIVARELGMPIRFALAPAPITSDPATWPRPPIIKTGVTIRTGSYDGLSIEESVESFFNDLSHRGAARRTISYGAGKSLIATFRGSPAGEIAFDIAHLRWVDPAVTTDLPRGDIVASSLLSVAKQLGEVSSTKLVTTWGSIESSLLFARLLHQDLHGRPLEANQVHLVHGVQAPKDVRTDNLPICTLHLALLACADPNEPASLRHPYVEQAQRFEENHRTILRELDGGVSGGPALDDPLVHQAVMSLNQGHFGSAFGHVCKLQKAIKKLPPSQRRELTALPAYLMLSSILANCEIPVSAAEATRLALGECVLGGFTEGGGRPAPNLAT